MRMVESQRDIEYARVRRHHSLGRLPSPSNFAGRQIVDSYLGINQMLLNFQGLIARCKEHNHLQLERKYQATVNSLRYELAQFKKMIAESQPTQQSTLLKKVTFLQDENRRLRRALAETKTELERSHSQIQKLQFLNVHAKLRSARQKGWLKQHSQPRLRPKLKVLENQLSSSRRFKQQQLGGSTPQFLKEVKAFLQWKQESNKATSMPRSTLQSFLWSKYDRCWNFSFPDFLKDLDEHLLRAEAEGVRAGYNWKSQFQQELIRLKFKTPKRVELRAQVAKQRTVRCTQKPKFWRISV